MKQAHGANSAPRHDNTAAVFSTVKYLLNIQRQKSSGRIFCLAFIVLVNLSAAAFAVAADRPVVREVLVSREGNGARIDIQANQPLLYRSYLMPGLEKWVVDLPGAKTTYSGDESKKMHTPPLERITVKEREVNGDLLTRIGLDFKGNVDFSLKEDQLDKGHLILIMRPLKATSKTKSTDAFPAAPP